MWTQYDNQKNGKINLHNYKHSLHISGTSLKFLHKIIKQTPCILLEGKY